MTRVFAYLRVSTSQQIDGDGFDRQRSACHKFAESKEWHVARTFEEAQSGSDAAIDRPRLMEALDLCGGVLGINTLIVERVDRIARDLVVAELFFRECKKRGIKVYSADTGEELVDANGDPTRILIRQILGALAEWDKAQICRKLQAGRRRKKADTGKPCGGSYAYGDNPNPSLRHSEQLIIRSIVASMDSEKESCNDIAKFLNLESVISPGGKVGGWHRSTVHYIWKQNQFRNHYDAV